MTGLQYGFVATTADLLFDYKMLYWKLCLGIVVACNGVVMSLNPRKRGVFWIVEPLLGCAPPSVAPVYWSVIVVEVLKICSVSSLFESLLIIADVLIEQVSTKYPWIMS
jgi:hypothetical protein